MKHKYQVNAPRSLEIYTTELTAFNSYHCSTTTAQSDPRLRSINRQNNHQPQLQEALLGDCFSIPQLFFLTTLLFIMELGWLCVDVCTLGTSYVIRHHHRSKRGRRHHWQNCHHRDGIEIGSIFSSSHTSGITL